MNLNVEYAQDEGKPIAAYVELLSALLAAQKTIKAVKKDRTNPHFRSMYADLAGIWEVVREPLHANNLMVTHATARDGDGLLILRSKLVHTNGACIYTELPLLYQTGNMQSLMAAITYAKRGNIGCLTGVVTEDEDDDGNATKPQQPAQAQQANGATRDTRPPAAVTNKPAPMSQQVRPPEQPRTEPVPPKASKNTDGSTVPHTIVPAPATVAEAIAWRDKLIGFMREQPRDVPRVTAWVAANGDVLEKMRSSTPKLWDVFAEAHKELVP